MIFHDILEFSKLVTPYVLHPFDALTVFLPHKWPISSIFGTNNFDPAHDIPDLNDKVIVVTGGNTGLGKETIFQLAQHRPKKIYLAARSEEKALQAIDDVLIRLAQTTENGEVKTELNSTILKFVHLDLTDLNSVKDAAEIISRDELRLDLLILNAGIMATPSAKTQHGHDLQLGTNHVGHFLFAILLLPLLKRTSKLPEADVRIISVSSEAHNFARPNFVELLEAASQEDDGDANNGYDSPYACYGASKAANILFAAEFARKYGSEQILSMSVHPGLILTNLYTPAKERTWVLGSILPAISTLAFDDVYHGSLNQLWCAAGAKRESLVNGAYYTPVGVQRQNQWTKDKVMAKQLWDWTLNELVKAGFIPAQW